MATGIYVNLPVKDLKRTTEFWEKLDFKFNPDFTDDNATCMIITNDSYVMFLKELFFKDFIGKKVISDSKTSTEAIVCFSVQSRQRVEDLINTALKNGAAPSNKPQDYGWMYSWGFQDPDGHLWEVVFMDEAAIPKE
ncbi:VOC family protein [Dysgonomonas sp. ZJ279]|uniref:VOC family protein n=1 Tax=Dysgonomonas sp. ZJ279 TaxID=2709796 RepID=UPI0013ECA4DB|nr:VOC family protein [Dysgonomonas sp. ZJ279]